MVEKQIEIDFNRTVKQIKHKQFFKDKVENKVQSKYYHSTQNVDFQYENQQQEHMDSKQAILNQQEKQLQMLQDKIQERQQEYEKEREKEIEKEIEQQKIDRLKQIQGQFLRSNIRTQDFSDKLSYQSPLLVQKNRSTPSQEGSYPRFRSSQINQNIDNQMSINRVSSYLSKNVLSNLVSIKEQKSEIQENQQADNKQVDKNDQNNKKQKQNIKKTNQQKIQFNIQKLFESLQKLEQNNDMISLKTLKSNLVELKQKNKLIVDRLFLSFGINPHQESEVMIDQDRFSQLMQFIYQDSIPFSKKVNFIIKFMKLGSDEIEYDKIERILRILIVEQSQNQEQLRIAYSQMLYILQKITYDNLMNEFQLRYVLFQQLVNPQLIIDLVLGNDPSGSLNTDSIQMLQTQ